MLRLFRPSRLHDERDEYIYYHMPMEHLAHTDAEDDMDLSNYCGKLCDLNKYGGEYAQNNLKHRASYSIFVFVHPDKPLPEYCINYGVMSAIVRQPVRVDYLIELQKVACAEIRIEHLGRHTAVMTGDHAEKIASLLVENAEPLECITQNTPLPESPELRRVLMSVKSATKLTIMLTRGAGEMERFYGGLIANSARVLIATISHLDDPNLFRKNLKSMLKSTQLISIALSFTKYMSLQSDFLEHLVDNWKSMEFVEETKRSQLAELFYTQRFETFLENEFHVKLTENKVVVRHPFDPKYKLRLVKTKPQFCDYMFRLIYEM